MQEHLIEHAAEHVAIAGVGNRDLNGLGDRASQGARRTGELLENFPADICCVRGGRGYLCAIGAHDLAAEGLLFIGAFDHEHLQVQTQIGTCHAQCRAPLTGAGLGGDALESLLLGVIGLCNGGIQLMAAAGVVALKFVVDLCRCAELFLETVGAHERRGTIHLIEITDFLRDRDVGGVVVELLRHQLLAEDGAELFGGHRLTGAGIEQGSGFDFHVRPDVVPCFGDFVFREIDFVGDFLFGHFNNSFPKRCGFASGQIKNASSRKPAAFMGQDETSCGATHIDALYAPTHRVPSYAPRDNGCGCRRSSHISVIG